MMQNQLQAPHVEDTNAQYKDKPTLNTLSMA